MPKHVSVQRAAAVSLFILALAAMPAMAAAPPLFPEPLHLTRVVDDPVTGSRSAIEEYCHGSVVVSVSGDRTVIADYGKQTVTEIDRAAGTYSVTPFAQLAAVAPTARKSSATSIEQAWSVRNVGKRAERGGAEYFEAKPNGARPVKKIEVGVDRGVRLSRDAAEVLVGAAYPRAASEENEIALRSAAPPETDRRVQSLSASAAVAATQTYGLPVEQIVTFDFDGKSVVASNRITRIGNETPPSDKIGIPPGARLVPSAALEARRALEEADRLPTSPAAH